MAVGKAIVALMLAVVVYAAPEWNCFKGCAHTPIPVCGSDGQTYGSYCALMCTQRTDSNKANLTEVHAGKCGTDNVELESNDECICYELYAPLCASDNQTYSNDCFFRCAKRNNPGLTARYCGRCVKDSSQLDQGYEIDPKSCMYT